MTEELEQTLDNSKKTVASLKKEIEELQLDVDRFTV
jgi:phage shock protein A